MNLLIIGRGESYKQVEFIKNFDGKIIACDSVVHEMIDKGIMPNYVTWLETSDTNVEWLVLSTLHRLKNSTLVYRYGAIPRVAEEAAKHKIHIKSFQPPTYVNNVGLFSIIFAQQVLHCKEIHLIGMEHRGGDYSENWFSDMIGAFSRFWPDRDKGCEIIDHSNNGRLFSSI